MTNHQHATSTRARSVAGVALLVVVALAGCGSVDTGAGEAAQVGSQRLTTETVLAQTTDVVGLAAAAGVPAANPSDINRAQVSAFVEQQLTAIVADELNVAVTNSDVDRFLAKVAEQNGVTRAVFENQVAVQPGSWVTPSNLPTFARTFLQQQAIAQKLAPTGTTAQRNAALDSAISKASVTNSVTVSPRYGTWDAASARVIDPANDLSAPPRLTSPTITSQPTAPPQG